jgi:hypothetical protein
MKSHDREIIFPFGGIVIYHYRRRVVVFNTQVEPPTTQENRMLQQRGRL